MRRGEMLMAKSFLFPDQLANLHHFVVICYEYCSINQIMKKGSYFKCGEDIEFSVPIVRMRALCNNFLSPL